MSVWAHLGAAAAFTSIAVTAAVWALTRKGLGRHSR